MWTTARVDLGLSDAEFWGLSPREFDALLKRRANLSEIENYRAGLSAAAHYNLNRKKKSDKLIHPLDFFRREKQITIASAEEIATKIDMTLGSCKAKLGR